jgi:hypothetical protein
MTASYQGTASEAAEKLDVALRFWVAQRFTAAITTLIQIRLLPLRARLSPVDNFSPASSAMPLSRLL